MKNLILITAAAFTLTGCAAAIPAYVAGGYVADIAMNTAVGGTAGKTISGDTARAAANGSETAHQWCGGYEIVSLADIWLLNPFTTLPMMDKLGAKSHCDRWLIAESNIFKDLKKSDDPLRMYCDSGLALRNKKEICKKFKEINDENFKN
jgi:hypothetical protein